MPMWNPPLQLNKYKQRYINFLEIQSKYPKVLSQSAVEIKTATTTQTVNIAHEALQLARDILEVSSGTVIFKVLFDSVMY